MSKFKEALERGKEARRQPGKRTRKERAEANVAVADFSTQAMAWMNDVVVATLEAAKADVAGEVTVHIDTAHFTSKRQRRLFISKFTGSKYRRSRSEGRSQSAFKWMGGCQCPRPESWRKMWET